MTVNRRIRTAILAPLAFVVLAVPAAWAKKIEADLAGVWDQEGGGQITIVQKDGRVEGTLSKPTEHGMRVLGLQRGVVMLSGRVKGNRVVGKARVHFPIKHAARCPRQWSRWEKAYFYLSSDGKTLNGKFKYPVLYLKNCHVTYAGWKVWRLTRKR